MKAMTVVIAVLMSTKKPIDPGITPTEGLVESSVSQTWRHTPTIPTLGRMRKSKEKALITNLSKLASLASSKSVTQGIFN